MAVHLITGFKGEEHIQSADQGSFNASFFGEGEFVMEAGNQCEASIIDNNTVRILDGDILMQGRHIRIPSNTYMDINIKTGTAGVNRNDLIVMEYSKDANSGIENADIKVIQGVASEGKATDPTFATGDILGGATLNQMPLYRVKVEGVVLSDVEQMHETIPTYKALAERYARQFEEACNTYLGALNILDSKEEIEANTKENQLAGALSIKEILASLDEYQTMYYDAENDDIYLKGTDGEWHFYSKGGLLADYIFKAPDGLQCSYAISNGRLIVEDTGKTLNIQQNANGTTGFMVLSKTMSEYIGQGKRLYFKAKTTTTDTMKFNIGSSANYSTSITSLNNTNSITVSSTEETYNVDIDTIFSNTNKYIGLSIASGYYQDVLSITEWMIK
jgi:hypothetical protein